jgi:hypothetical protein
LASPALYRERARARLSAALLLCCVARRSLSENRQTFTAKKLAARLAA